MGRHLGLPLFLPPTPLRFVYNTVPLIIQQSRALFFHKNIRLAAERYIGQQWYFVTLCCQGRRAVFAIPARALWFIDILRKKSAAMQFSVYAYCVMPDHVHMLVYGLEPSSNLRAFVKALKQETAFEFQRQAGRELWQKKFYDHILRSDDPVPSVAGYIWMNPVRKGLCDNPTEHAFTGSFVVDWKHCSKPSKPWTPNKRFAAEPS